MGIQQLFDPNISKRERDKIAYEILQFASGYSTKVPETRRKSKRKIDSSFEKIFNATFKQETPLAEVENNKLPTGDYVYALKLKGKKVQTVSGKSTSFLYFGHTNSLSRRIIKEYFRGYGGKTSKRLHILLMEKGYKDKVEVSFTKARDKTEARYVEGWLRILFYNEFNQLPVWNRQE